MTSLIRTPTFLAAAMLLFTACGGLAPGDYIVYRVAFQQSEQGEDCYAGGSIPVNEQDDSSSLFTAGTFILYMGSDEVPYLDTGTLTLAGEGDGDAFTFTGETVDVNYPSGTDMETKETTRQSTTIDVTIDGATIDGVVRQKTEYSCTGTLCPDPPENSCTVTTPFVGGEVEDVDLKHEV